MSRHFVSIIVAGLSELALTGVANAQAYPVKPIRIIAPFAPGGATDILAGFEASPWTGVSVPAGTPKEIIARPYQEIAKGFNAPDTRDRLARDGNEVVTSTPEEFDAFFRAQMVKRGKVTKDANTRVD
jgi:tripartite-type tricarboxylate transporter receptor subunit TctC